MAIPAARGNGNDAGEPAIAVRGLTIAFGDFVLQRDLEFTVGRGEIFVLMGGSGCGKTTVMKVLTGLKAPRDGQVLLDGVSLWDLPDAERLATGRRMGIVYQQGALWSSLTLAENVALPLRELRCFDEDFIRDMVMLKLGMVDIEPRHAMKMPAELSGGMVKRIALARALALEPELVFLDEPTAGLDPDRSESFVKLIAGLRRELNLTVVMVTHDLDTLVAAADRVAVLAEQRVLINGTLQEVVAAKHPFIVNFFLGERGLRALSVLRPPGADGAAAHPL